MQTFENGDAVIWREIPMTVGVDAVVVDFARDRDMYKIKYIEGGSIVEKWVHPFQLEPA